MSENGLVVKSNRLIEASYRISLMEQRLVLMAIVTARETQQGIGSGLLTIRAQDFGRVFQIDDKNVYDQLKAAVKTLYERSVSMESDGGATKLQVRWLSVAGYNYSEGSIKLSFTPEIAPFITRLESEFTSYRLEKIGRMTSVYAVRLYEMLVQHLAIGKRQITLEELRKTLMLEDEYPRISDLKRWVVDVAVDQINEFSDIKVKYAQGKTGRAVTHFDFTIRTRPDPKPEKPQKSMAAGAIDRAYIEKHARPGESYDMAYRRLIEERGQTRLVD